MLEPGKILQFFRVFAGNPAGFIKGQRIELNRSAIFMQKAILNDLKLQFTNTADDFLIAAVLGEQLGDAFIGQLQQPFF